MYGARLLIVLIIWRFSTDRNGGRYLGPGSSSAGRPENGAGVRGERVSHDVL